MEFEEELGIPPPSYDHSLPNRSRIKMPTHHQPQEPSPPARNSGRGRYMECLKNHAITIGGYALDGCCEFMAAGPHGTIDALKCAACNCHRNFHRNEILPVTCDPSHHHSFHNRRHQQFPQLAYRAQGGASGYLHVSGQQQRGRGGGGGPLALPSISGGGARQITREEQEDVSEPSGGGGGGSSSSKKRHRTKFTQEQKEKMLGFAERVGWRVQKHDEPAMEEFCHQVGVKRHVLKVWMHNNKNTLGKKP